MTPAVEDRVRTLVDQAPPLGDEQRRKLGLLLATPADEGVVRLEH